MPNDLAKREVITWYPTTAVECACRLDQRPNLIILIGFNNVATCPMCRYQVMATGVRLTKLGYEIQTTWMPPAKERT